MDPALRARLENAERLAKAIEGKPVRFRHWDTRVAAGYYVDGRLAFRLRDVRDDAHVATATVNVVEFADSLAGDEVFIKDYGENEGILAALVEAGVVEDTGQSVETGFVRAKVARVRGG